MGNSQYPNKQQAEAPPPQKYELPEEDLKAGLLKRFSVGLLISHVFVLFKDVLFGWGELATARADSVINIDPGNKNIELPSLVLIDTPEPIDQGDLEDEPVRPVLKLANAGSASIDTFFTIEQPIDADPVQLRSSAGHTSAASNDNEPAGPAVGSNANDLQPQVGGGTGGSGGGNGRGGLDDGILNANAIGVVRAQITDFQVGDKIDLSDLTRF